MTELSKSLGVDRRARLLFSEAQVSPMDYADHLVQIVRGLRTRHSLSFAAVSMAQPSQLETRLPRIGDRLSDDPIIQNKMLFFAGYQGTKTRSDPADRTGFVPTPRMLAGDFTGCAFAQLRDPNTGANYPNNQIPPSQFSSQALAIVKQLPAAQGSCGETKFS